MGRPHRIIVPNYPHHIVQRGHNRNAVFAENSDYEYYLNALLQFKELYGVKVYSWCLMSNHVHLILDPGDDPESISHLMKRLSGRQTRRMNRLNNRSGSLWEGRFKLSPIGSDEYLMQCCRYVELNPVKADIVKNPEDYWWSSFRAKVGLEHSALLDIDTFYRGLKQPRISYKEFVISGSPEAEATFIRNQVARNQLTGSDAFIEEIAQRCGIRIESRAPGRPPRHP